MKPAIIDIPGIGPAAAAALAEHSIKTLTDLAKASVETISAVPGFSEARATRVIDAARDLLPAPAETIPEKDTGSGKEKKGGKGKKGKGKGKGKGKKKDKKNKGKKKDKGKKKPKK
jgi:Holliday junction resolvasome RuvABC DNA-binding subunit